MNLILASASPRRRELLATLGIPFSVRASTAEELREGPWMMLALENALRKAEEVAARFPEDLVIGADTVIEFENRILGKPENMDDAFRMLSMFSGKTHCVTTGCAIICHSRSIRIRFAETSRVTFKSLDAETIRRYLSLVPVLDKAGAYAIQDHGEMLIESLEGSLDNVIGFPTDRFRLPLKFLLN